MNANIRRSCKAMTAGVLAVLITACASQRSPRKPRAEQALHRTQMALEAAGDADSLAAAAELSVWHTGDHARQVALLARAVALEPARADLVWLELEACAQMTTCAPRPIAAALHALDPENCASWLPLLDRAARRGDAEVSSKDLRAIGQCNRFDIYWNGSISHMTTAVIKVHTMNAATALTAVIGVEAALAIPAYGSVSKACEPPASDEPGRLITCRNIAAALRSGDTYISEMLGIAITKRVWPANSTEYADADAQRRLGQYRMRAAADITGTALHNNSKAMEYLQLLSTHRAEQEVALAVITAAGKDPEPPAAWNNSYAE